MKRFEYFTIGEKEGENPTLEDLNEKGKNGWRVIHISFTGGLIVFERELDESDAV